MILNFVIQHWNGVWMTSVAALIVALMLIAMLYSARIEAIDLNQTLINSNKSKQAKIDELEAELTTIRRLHQALRDRLQRGVMEPMLDIRGTLDPPAKKPRKKATKRVKQNIYERLRVKNALDPEDSPNNSKTIEESKKKDPDILDPGAT